MTPRPSCCEAWPVCRCDREARILSLANSRDGRVFENPQKNDTLALPGISYVVMHVRDDGAMVVGAVWEDPWDADYIQLTLDQWQDRCLQPGAKLRDGAKT